MVLLAAAALAIAGYMLFEFLFEYLLSAQINLAKRLEDTLNIENLNSEDDNTKISLTEHLIRPVFERIIEIIELFVPRNEAALVRLNQQLKAAGSRENATHYSANVIFKSIAFAVVFAVAGFNMTNEPVNAAQFGALGGVAGLILSRFSLKSAITKRKNEIHHQVSGIMDLLSISVASGLGFDQALGYVVEKSKGALIDELDTARREITLGKSRRNALSDFAERCDDLELNTFVAAVLQADEMGSSLQNVLKIQADTIRETHKQGVEEQAQKLTVKMLIPLILFIFPVFLIVLIGPAIITIIEMIINGGIG